MLEKTNSEALELNILISESTSISDENKSKALKKMKKLTDLNE